MKDNTFGQMEEDTRENGKMICLTAKDRIFGQTEADIEENGRTIV